MSETKPINDAKNLQKLQGPTLIRYSDATRFLWGDEKSHRVSDWYYGTGDRIAAFMFSLRSGEHFGYSENWKTLYDQERIYYVLQGSLVLHDPETGDVAVAEEGEAVFWHGNRWHFGYNFGERETLILEGCVPPQTEAEVITSPQKPDLSEIVNGRYDLLGDWPAGMVRARSAALSEGALVTIRREDCLRIISGTTTPTLVSLFVSTARMTAGFVDLGTGKMGDPETHPGDKTIVCTRGRLNIYLPETHDWFELHAKDSFFVPEGVAHQYANMTDETASFFFTVAPLYR